MNCIWIVRRIAMLEIKKMSGLADWQVNGYKGVDFNQRGLTAEEVEKAGKALIQEGVTSFFPTLITNHPDEISRLIRTIIKADDSLGATIAGIHLEGPFISNQEGARGAHPAEYATFPHWKWMEKWLEESEGRVRLITIAPEWKGSEEFISRCVEAGVKVAIGHTLATEEQIASAVAAGATLSTHLGNGSPVMIKRHPNPIWEQLSQDRLWISAIGDGFHLPEQVIRVFSKVKREKMFWISDSTAFSGETPGEYESYIGGNVVLTSEGKLHMKENPDLLAGAAMSLRQMIENAWKKDWFTLEEAWRMGSEYPWNFLGAACPDGDEVEVLLDQEQRKIDIQRVWKKGVCVWKREE